MPTPSRTGVTVARRTTARRAPASSAPRPETFQGRPIVRIHWKGQAATAVGGVNVCRLRESERVVRAAAERGLQVTAGGAGQPLLGIGIVEERPAFGPERGSGWLAGLDDLVMWTEPLLLDHGSGVPNDPYLSQQWALEDVSAESAWDVMVPVDGRVVLAVLDSGLPMQSGKLSHADLDDPRYIAGRDVVNNDDDPADDHGHGTHVLGIAAAQCDNALGVAGLWRGAVLVLKVFDSALNGSSVTFKDGVALAVDFARARDARLVINYSGGGPDSNTKKAAVEYAQQNGALIVVAAGNRRGWDIEFPAAYAGMLPNVIAVGAVDRGRRRPAFGTEGPQMTVVAPGTDILSTLPNYFVTLNREGKQTKYDRLDGTSQATPLVSALASLLWTKHPDWTAAQIRDHISSTADRIDGNRDVFGGGIINITRAVQL